MSKKGAGSIWVATHQPRSSYNSYVVTRVGTTGTRKKIANTAATLMQAAATLAMVKRRFPSTV